MRKTILFLGSIGLLALAGMYPVNQDEKGNQNALPLNITCPAFIVFSPSSFLEWIMDSSALRFMVGEEYISCTIKKLMEREKREDEKIYLDSTLLIHAGRPDLAAHFLDRLVSRGNFLAAKELAALYDEGNGVPQNKKKAESLLQQVRAETNN